jgi:hypothetical protein
MSPQTKAAATTDLQAAGLNPYGNQAVAGGVFANITLVFETGRNPDLDGLLTAIESHYGAGKVTIDTDTTARQNMRLRVAA